MLKKLLILTCVLVCAGCSSPYRVNLATENERTPRPHFQLKDLSAENAHLSYGRLKVYKKVDSCDVPNCEVVWSASVSDIHSPQDFHYGHDLGMGTFFFAPPTELERNSTYELVLLRNRHVEHDVVTSFTFEVDGSGKVLPVIEE